MVVLYLYLVESLFSCLFLIIFSLLFLLSPSGIFYIFVCWMGCGPGYQGREHLSGQYFLEVNEEDQPECLGNKGFSERRSQSNSTRD
jgi:hypothetical protein